MANYPSIYSSVVFDLHPQVKKFIDDLNSRGQIDLDQSGYPYLIKSEKQGSNYITHISRNNKIENFVLNPRRRAQPIFSWNANDGYERKEAVKASVNNQERKKNGSERERRKVSFEDVQTMVESIMEK